MRRKQSALHHHHHHHQQHLFVKQGGELKGKVKIDCAKACALEKVCSCNRPFLQLIWELVCKTSQTLGILLLVVKSLQIPEWRVLTM
jgi:hypothetical protein